MIEQPQNQTRMRMRNNNARDLEDIYVVTTVHSDDEGEEEEATREKPTATTTATTTTTTQPPPQQTRRRERPTLRTSPSNILDDSERRIAFRDEIDPWYDDQQQQQQQPEPPLLPSDNVESAREHFHRVLDQVLTRKRKGAVLDALQDLNDDDVKKEFLFSKPGAVRHPGSRQKTEAGSSVKDRLEALRAELSAGPSRDDLDKIARVNQMLGKEGRRALTLVGVCLLLLMLLWGGLGSYGLYVLLYSQASPIPAIANFRAAPTPAAVPEIPSAATQEIVIRVVKEVVHVNAEGKELGRGPWSKHGSDAGAATAEEYEKVAACVANVYS